MFFLKQADSLKPASKRINQGHSLNVCDIADAINQSINQSTNQSINPSIHPSIDASIHPLKKRAFELLVPNENTL